MMVSLNGGSWQPSELNVQPSPVLTPPPLQPPLPPLAPTFPSDTWSASARPAHFVAGPSGVIRTTHVEQEGWYWVRVLRDFAPVVASLGAIVGAGVGLVAGTPALGAAWGAAIITAIPPSVMLWEYVRDLVLHLRRGEQPGPVGDALRFFGGVFLPTATVALGAFWGATVGAGVAVFGALGGAVLLTLAGQVYLRVQSPRG